MSKELETLIKNRKFWISLASVTAVGLVFYDWYKDRYSTPLERFNRIKEDYIISERLMREIRIGFLKEMELGLSENDEMIQKDKKSSLKMLSSKIYNVPTGKEKGIYYTLDWGGSNYRVLRIELKGNNNVVSKEHKVQITKEYQNAKNANLLFDHLTGELHKHMKTFNEHDYNTNGNKYYQIGFTFSFPMSQPKLDTGILLEWTKGFNVPGVVGNNITELMHKSFELHNIPAKIHAIVNDTVGTLLACAYEYKNVRIGLILGTGSNACYIEPLKDNEIINIEWGNFNKLLPRTPIDFIIDENTPNRGSQFMEKMISGYYLGELVRLLSLEVYRDYLTNYYNSNQISPFFIPWKFESSHVTKILEDNTPNLDQIDKDLKNIFFIYHFTLVDREILQKICRLIVNRSADLAAICLSSVLEKTGMYKTIGKKNDKNPYELDNYELLVKENTVIGIDGSVFKYIPNYENRMKQTFYKLLGKNIADKIQLVHSEDGSGKGAALAVAATVEL